MDQIESASLMILTGKVSAMGSVFIAMVSWRESTVDVAVLFGLMAFESTGSVFIAT